MNKKIVKTQVKNDQEFNEYILNPRIQTQNNDEFEYIEAEKGLLSNEQNYIFEKVKMKGDYGIISAGRLNIKDNKNLWEFTINPKFTIYVDGLKN